MSKNNEIISIIGGPIYHFLNGPVVVNPNLSQAKSIETGPRLKRGPYVNLVLALILFDDQPQLE